MTGAAAERLAQLKAYHDLSKHRFDGYAPGPETLDWDDQPNVFRHFDGAPQIPLPAPDRDRADTLPFEVLHQGGAAVQALNLLSLSRFLRYTAGLTAWKTYGPDRWSLRANPSSGNLHPSELYLLLPASAEWDAGLYHYDVLEHALEQRAALPGLPLEEPLLVLTSVLQRELWKYGERGLRYCLLDTGHLLAQCRASAALNGWDLAPVAQPHPVLASLSGIDREDYAGVEAEYPELLLQLQTDAAPSEPDWQQLMRLCREAGIWQGRPGRLGPRPLQQWRQALAMMAQFDRSPGLNLPAYTADSAVAVEGATATMTILQRRSAQGYDNQRQLTQSELVALLKPLQPGMSRLQLTPAQIHPVLLIHSVEGVEPGIYLLARSGEGETLLRRELTRWSDWQSLELAPGLVLWRLKIANTRKAAAQLCCNQMIAASSALTLLMLAEFEPVLGREGANGYQQLFHEAGMLGQSLYLSATALGLNGTGIGCFFDDPVHELLGIESQQLQVIYGFALGQGQQDRRVTGLSGYFHRREVQDV